MLETNNYFKALESSRKQEETGQNLSKKGEKSKKPQKKWDIVYKRAVITMKTHVSLYKRKVKDKTMTSEKFWEGKKQNETYIRFKNEDKDIFR